MDEATIHAQLQEQWGDDYPQRFGAASKVVTEIFANDQPLFKWFEGRVGSHINIVRLADRLSAMLDGARPQKVAAPSTATTKSLDGAIAEFQPGGTKHDRWINSNDRRLNDERLALYSRKYLGKIILE